jgi:hypothetical protein
MAEYALPVPGAARLASLTGLKSDLEQVVEYCGRMIDRYAGAHLKESPFDIVAFTTHVDFIDWEARLEELAVATEASGRPLHAIVSTDGDSDRPLVTAVLPAAEVHPGSRRVRFLPGDLLGIVVAEYLRADAAAVPISANDAVAQRMGERAVSLQKTKIGSPYVISALDELRRGGTHARIVGWEANSGSDVGMPATNAGHGTGGREGDLHHDVRDRRASRPAGYARARPNSR